MRLLAFLNDYARDEAFRAQFRGAVDTVERVRILRQRFGLADREIGAILREDRLEVLRLLSLEVAGYDFGSLKVAAPVGAIGDEEDQGICWPGPVALALDGCTPAEFDADHDQEVMLTGFHVAQLATVDFVKDTRRVHAHVVGIETDAISGRSWVKLKVKLPDPGVWLVELSNQVGAWQMTARLPDAVKVSG